jgi:ubiquinone/menaquinone biosynthesis C-methylase UbiE
MNIDNPNKTAAELHEDVPPGWYFESIKINILQRYWHKKRFEEVGKLIEPVGGKILDIGCADGTFTKVILDKSKAQKIIAIDVLKDSIKWAERHWKRNKKMKFMVGDAHNLKFGANSFDAVFALEILEHVFDPIKVFKEIKRVLKKGGYAIFLVPTDSILFNIVWFFWTKYRGKIWKDTHIHTYKRNYLTQLLEEQGFVEEENSKFILGMLQVVKVRKK